MVHGFWGPALNYVFSAAIVLVVGLEMLTGARKREEIDLGSGIAREIEIGVGEIAVVTGWEEETEIGAGMAEIGVTATATAEIVVDAIHVDTRMIQGIFLLTIFPRYSAFPTSIRFRTPCIKVQIKQKDGARSLNPSG